MKIINSFYNPIFSNSILKLNKIIKNNKTQMTNFIKNHQHKKIISSELNIVEEKLRSR